MTRRRKTLVLAANPQPYRYGRHFVGYALGSPIAHAAFAAKNGAVLWDLIQTGFRHADCRIGYFYDVPSRSVSHRFRIEYIKRRSKIDEEEKEFLPSWRAPSWRYLNRFFVKMKDVYELTRPRHLRDIRLYETGGRARAIRAYVIAIDPRFRTLRRPVRWSSLAHDIIRNHLKTEGELREKMVGDLVEYHLLSKHIPFEREFQTERGLLDFVVCRDDGSTALAIELKLTARPQDLDQLERYVRAVEKEEKRTVKRVLLCEYVSPEVRDLVRSPRWQHVELKQNRFALQIPDIIPE